MKILTAKGALSGLLGPQRLSHGKPCRLAWLTRSRRGATIHRDHLAGDEATLIGAEQRDRGSDLRRQTGAAERHAKLLGLFSGVQLLLPILPHRTG